MTAPNPPRIPLPKSWTRHVRSAMLHVAALAEYASVFARSRAAGSANAPVRLNVENDHLRQELCLIEEELRIKDAHTDAGLTRSPSGTSHPIGDFR